MPNCPSSLSFELISFEFGSFSYDDFSAAHFIWFHLKSFIFRIFKKLYIADLFEVLLAKAVLKKD